MRIRIRFDHRCWIRIPFLFEWWIPWINYHLSSKYYAIKWEYVFGSIIGVKPQPLSPNPCPNRFGQNPHPLSPTLPLTNLLVHPPRYNNNRRNKGISTVRRSTSTVIITTTLVNTTPRSTVSIDPPASSILLLFKSMITNNKQHYYIHNNKTLLN